MPWASGGTTTDDGYLAAFAESGQQYRVRLALHLVSGVSPSFTTRYVGDLPFLGSPTLDMNARNAVIRTLSVQTPLAGVSQSVTEALQAVQYAGGQFRSEARLPADPKALGDALTAGAYVNVMVGMALPSTGQAGFTNVEKQIAQLSVRRVTGADGSVASLEMADWMSVIEENPLITTYAPVDGAGNPITRGEAITELVEDAFPLGWFGTVIPALSLIDVTPLKSGLSFTGSRYDAIAQILEPTSFRLTNMQTGMFTISGGFDLVRIGQSATVVWQFGSDRAYPSPIFDYTTELAESSGFNAVPINWQSDDGQSYGTVFLVDNDPASPTFWNGPYGHRRRRPSRSTPRTARPRRSRSPRSGSPPRSPDSARRA